MPKNANGCFMCGQPTSAHYQAVLVAYHDTERDAQGHRKHETVDAVSRSLCAACGDAYAAQARTLIRRTTDSYHGCGVCGARTEGRVVVRTCVPRMTSVAAVSYCDDHLGPAYESVADPLGWDLPRTRGGTSGYDGARGRRATA